MKTTGKIKWLFMFMMAMLIWVWFSYAQNVNTLSITPSTYTWRYFCPIDLSVMANYNEWPGFTNCQYTLKFDPSVIELWYASRGSAYSETDTVDHQWNMLFVEEKTENPITQTVSCSNLVLTGIGASVSAATINFVNASGNIPTTYDFLHTEDLLNLSYNGADTLTWVQDLTINFYACPCDLDNTAPTITNWSHDSNTHYTGDQIISFLAYDKGGSLRKYWTNWSKDLSNYTWWAPAWMDNQEWVNSGTISIKVITENGDELPIIPNSIIPYTWYISSTPQYTWDGNYRWYFVSFETSGLQVETPMTIVVSVSDNALNWDWWCTTSAHTKVYTGKLNQKEAPTIALNSPTWQNINPNVWVELTVSDSRAWVDTGSVVFEILPITSGWQLIMSWSIYSWSDLHFELIDWSTELWWASKYRVSFQPTYDFAVSSTITISWYAKDYVEMETYQTFTFGTRADCTFYGCVNFVDIFSGTRNNLIQWHFTWSLIVVTGTLAPYPYLTWADGDIVMCGPIDESINLTWSVDIYSEWQRINGNLYPYEDLYVTGLDFTYESGVITPIY